MNRNTANESFLLSFTRSRKRKIERVEKKFSHLISPKKRARLVQYYQRQIASATRWVQRRKATHQFGGVGVPDVQPFQILRETQKHIKKYNATAFTQKIQLNPNARTQEENWYSFVSRAFEAACAQKLENLQDDDFVRAVMNCEGFSRPISTIMLRKRDFSSDYLLSVLERVLQSNETVDFTVPVTLYLTAIEQPRGGISPWLVRHVLTAAEARERLRCIMQVRVVGNLCLPAALAAGQTLMHEGRGTVLRNLCKRERVRLLERRAKALYLQVFGADHNPQHLCTLDDLNEFQRYFYDDVKIILFRWSPKRILWQGNVNAILPMKNKVFLLYDEQTQHFDLILSPAPFLRRSNFCLQCLKGYDRPRDHACFQNCKGCMSPNCPDKNLDEGIPCTDCNRVFPGRNCFQRHINVFGQGRSLCQRFKKCTDCGKVHRRRPNENHDCKRIWCAGCKSFVETNHLCYIKPIQRQHNEINDTPDVLMEHLVGENQCTGTNLDFEEHRYVYYDMEAYPDANTGEHVCNLVVAQDNQGGGEVVFAPPGNPVNAFCKWALNPLLNKNTTFVAHNAKRYDSYLVLRWILFNIHERVEPIAMGGQLLLIHLKDLKVRFIDSISFLTAALAKLPKMFGFDFEGGRRHNGAPVSKGFFPHTFNRPRNYGYCGPMPDVAFYEPEAMNPARRAEFYEWYNQQVESNYEFRFWDELIAYCKQDVKVLRLCCERFREIFHEHTTVDPFQSITIASACNVVYRKCFLEQDTVAIIPPDGYAGHDKQSYLATLWLLWRQFEAHGRPMRHSRNGRELRINLPIRKFYKIDGVWINDDGTETKELLKFLGCFFHGCSRCYRPDTWNPLLKKRMGSLQADFMVRKAMLDRLGFQTEWKWECDWRGDIQHNPGIQEFVREQKHNAFAHGNVDLIEPLNPRDAFFGGRTNAACLYYKLEKGSDDKIRYIDINSLYPYVNKYFEWPVGHPEVLVGPAAREDKIEQYFGLAKCFVLPPQDLYHPALPVRIDNKLMFPLCRKCAEEKIRSPCEHVPTERALYGTWVTVELVNALQHGYELLRLDEVWHFPQRSTILFAGYINRFLKLKQEAKGFPAHINPNDPDQVQAYVEAYEEAEGVVLDADKTQENPGLYQVAKVCLNSFWGKFGQRLNLGKMALIHEEDEFWRFMLNDSIEISDLIFHGEEIAQMEYKDNGAFVSPRLNTNIVVAACTTANARTHLWNTLGPLKERALYYDTDSIIFVDIPNEWKPPTGEFLGEFKDELESRDGEDWIVEFMSGGPKNYGYVTKKEKQCLKVRGFTLNQLASESLNLAVVRQMVTSMNPETGKCEPSAVDVDMGSTIKRDKKTWTLETTANQKSYRMVYEKRIICGDGRYTVPYGYRAQ